MLTRYHISLLQSSFSVSSSLLGPQLPDNRQDSHYTLGGICIILCWGDKKYLSAANELHSTFLRRTCRLSAAPQQWWWGEWYQWCSSETTTASYSFKSSYCSNYSLGYVVEEKLWVSSCYGMRLWVHSQGLFDIIKTSKRTGNGLQSCKLNWTLATFCI